jgi:hypothetical protein
MTDRAGLSSAMVPCRPFRSTETFASLLHPAPSTMATWFVAPVVIPFFCPYNLCPRTLCSVLAPLYLQQRSSWRGPGYARSIAQGRV